MARRFSSHAVKLAMLLRDLNPDIQFAPALERHLGKKVRTVDVAPPPAPTVPACEPKEPVRG